MACSSCFILNSYKTSVCFLKLCCIIYTSYSNSFSSNLFWDCANGFLNFFSVYNDFNATNNFIRFLNFTHSFVEVNVVSYDGNHNISELMNKSKPGSNGSSRNAILIFLFLASSFFHLLIKKPDVRVKIISLATFFFIGSSIKHHQCPILHHDINVCS